MNRFRAAEEISIDIENKDACRELIERYGTEFCSLSFLTELGEKATAKFYPDKIVVLRPYSDEWFKATAIYIDGTVEEYFQK